MAARACRPELQQDWAGTRAAERRRRLAVGGRVDQHERPAGVNTARARDSEPDRLIETT
jgi:hypothetical protein